MCFQWYHNTSWSVSSWTDRSWTDTSWTITSWTTKTLLFTVLFLDRHFLERRILDWRILDRQFLVRLVLAAFYQFQWSRNWRSRKCRSRNWWSRICGSKNWRSRNWRSRKCHVAVFNVFTWISFHSKYDETANWQPIRDHFNRISVQRSDGTISLHTSFPTLVSKQNL